jgi:tetratricopeptide (TPR) repeat protein
LVLEVRLERFDASLVSNAYTRGSYEFLLQVSSFDPNEHYFLVIKEKNFKELRYELDINNFHVEEFPDRNAWASTPDYCEKNKKECSNYLYTYNGMATLELESLDSKEKLSSSKVVSIRKIPANIPDAAVKEYDQAIEDINKGDNGAGLIHLEKAVELAPDYFDAINKLGAEYLKAGQYEKAEAMLIRARTLDPKDPSSLTNLGTIYIKQGEKLAASTPAEAEDEEDIDEGESKPGEASFRKAVEVLEEALKLDPQSARSNFYLGTALYRVGEYQRAESLLLNALILDKQLQDARLTLLNIYMQQKQYDAALEQIAAFLEANPDSPQREQLEKFRAQIKNAMNQ